MKSKQAVISLVVLALAITVTAPTQADSHGGAMRSNVAFNNGTAEETANQPAGGMQVAYQTTLQGGDLDGCVLDIVETLFGRDEGAWGIFDIEGTVTCDNGSFSYTSTGAWDGNGFHAAGAVNGGSGDFDGASGRVAQLGGSAKVIDDGTWDIAYELVVDLSKG